MCRHEVLLLRWVVSILWAACSLFAPSNVALAGDDGFAISNVVVSVDSGKFFVKYDLTGSADEEYIVTIEMRRTGDPAFRYLPMDTFLSGAVRRGQRAGQEKLIEWDVEGQRKAEQKDEDFLLAGDFYIKVEATIVGGGISPWLYVGGGIVVVGAAAAILLTKKDDTPTPLPPDVFPNEPGRP